MPRARGQLRSHEVRARVLRADGTTEDLGRVAYWHANPVLNWWGQRSVRRA